MGSQHKCQFPQRCNNQTIQPSHKCTRCMVTKHEICVSAVVTQYTTVCHFNNNQSAPDCPCGCMVPHFEDTDCVTVEKSGTLPVQQLRICLLSVTPSTRCHLNNQSGRPPAVPVTVWWHILGAIPISIFMDSDQ